MKDKNRVKTRKPNIECVWDNLPVALRKDELIASVRKHMTTVVVGETGSGKSTQLPKYLSEALSNGNGCVVCTQPRRVAAVTVASRVAKELNVELGEEVGYNIRFEDKTSKKTKIKFVTDGVLLRECMVNSSLEGYDAIILDEAHERSLSTDILMGLIKQIQDKNPKMKLVVMSATLQVSLFMSFFNDTNLVQIEGRQHPVEVMYLKEAQEDYVDAALRTCAQIHANEAPGGVLVFLPGQDDIESLQALLQEHLPSIPGRSDESAVLSKRKHLEARLASVSEDIHEESGVPSTPRPPKVIDAIIHDFEVSPLYAAMPADEQYAVFTPPPLGVRKFILSTNIAETSVTISGIRYVVDCGFYKCRTMEPRTGVEMLKVSPVSQAQCNQRAGRAGRECPGKCYRVFPEHAFESLDEATVPEIQRVSINQVLLQLLGIGVGDPTTFPYPSPPSTDSIQKAGRELHYLGALEMRDNTQKLSPLGVKMANLPLEPVYSALLLKSADPKYRCVKEMLTIVSMLSTDGIFIQPHKDAEKQAASKAHRLLASSDGDIPTLLNIYVAWLHSRKSAMWAQQSYLSQRALLTADNIRDQLSSLLSKQQQVDVKLSCMPDRTLYMKCLAAGLCLNVAQKQSVESSSTGITAGAAPRHVAKSAAMRNFANAISLPGAAKVRESGPYVTLRGRQPVHIHPSSVLFSQSGGTKRLPDFVVYSDLLITSKQYMRGITAIQSEWLEDIPGGLFKKVPTPAAVGSTTSGVPGVGERNTEKEKVQKAGKRSSSSAQGLHANLHANRGASRPMLSVGNYVPKKRRK